MTRKLILFSLFLTLLFPSCTKEYGYLAGIVFTIDDGNVSFWYPYFDYLDSFHFKLTFYVTGYHEFSEAEKTMLKNFSNQNQEMPYRQMAKDGVPEIPKKK